VDSSVNLARCSISKLVMGSPVDHDRDGLGVQWRSEAQQDQRRSRDGVPHAPKTSGAKDGTKHIVELGREHNRHRQICRISQLKWELPEHSNSGHQILLDEPSARGSSGVSEGRSRAGT